MYILGSPIFCLFCFNFLPSKTAKASHKLPTSNTKPIIKKQRLKKTDPGSGHPGVDRLPTKDVQTLNLGGEWCTSSVGGGKLADSAAGSR